MKKTFFTLGVVLMAWPAVAETVAENQYRLLSADTRLAGSISGLSSVCPFFLAPKSEFAEAAWGIYHWGESSFDEITSDSDYLNAFNQRIYSFEAWEKTQSPTRVQRSVMVFRYPEARLAYYTEAFYCHDLFHRDLDALLHTRWDPARHINMQEAFPELN